MKKMIVVLLILCFSSLNVAMAVDCPGPSGPQGSNGGYGESSGPAPNSGDGIPDGSGFDGPNGPQGPAIGK